MLIVKTANYFARKADPDLKAISYKVSFIDKKML